jgi:hypothetical protein
MLYARSRKAAVTAGVTFAAIELMQREVPNAVTGQL